MTDITEETNTLIKEGINRKIEVSLKLRLLIAIAKKIIPDNDEVYDLLGGHLEATNYDLKKRGVDILDEFEAACIGDLEHSLSERIKDIVIFGQQKKMTDKNKKITREDILDGWCLLWGLYEDREEDLVKINSIKNDPRVNGLVKWANRYPAAWHWIECGICEFNLSDEKREEILQLGEENNDRTTANHSG